MSQAFKGSIRIGEETKPNASFNTLVLSSEENETGVQLTATEDDTEFILVRMQKRKFDIE